MMFRKSLRMGSMYSLLLTLRVPRVSALTLDPLLVSGKYFAHRVQYEFFDAGVIAPRRQGESDLMPEKICARDLLEDAIRLKDGRGGERGDSAGGSRHRRPADFHHVQADQSDVHDFAGHAGDLYAVAHAHAVFSDKKEVAGHRHDPVLH